MGINTPRFKPTPRPSQQGIEQRYGARPATAHQGSKRGTKSRLTEKAQAQIMARPATASRHKARQGILDPGRPHTSDQVRERAPQRCLPPHARVRTDQVAPARPLNSAEREGAYVRRAMGIPASIDLEAVFVAATVMGPPAQTAAQRRRIEHKLHHAMAKARGTRFTGNKNLPLRKTPKGTTQPDSGRWSRGFVKMVRKLRPADRSRALYRKLMEENR